MRGSVVYEVCGREKKILISGVDVINLWQTRSIELIFFKAYRFGIVIKIKKIQ